MHEGNPVLNYTNSGAMVHRRLLYIYLLNVPSFSSRYCKKNKINVSFREIASLIARNSLICCIVLVYNHYQRFWFCNDEQSLIT